MPAPAMSACARRGGRGKEGDGGRCRCRRGGHFLRAAADPGEGAVPGWSRAARPWATQLPKSSRRVQGTGLGDCEGRRRSELVRCKAAEGLVPPGGSGGSRPGEGGGGVSGCSPVPLRTPSPGSSARPRRGVGGVSRGSPFLGSPATFFWGSSAREAAVRRQPGVVLGCGWGSLCLMFPAWLLACFQFRGVYDREGWKPIAPRAIWNPDFWCTVLLLMLINYNHQLLTCTIENGLQVPMDDRRGVNSRLSVLKWEV